MKMRTRLAAAAAVGCALLAGTASTAAAETSPSPAPTAAPVGYSATGTWQLLALVHKHRRALGMPALTVDPELAANARKHTETMAATGILRHNDALFTSASHKALG